MFETLLNKVLQSPKEDVTIDRVLRPQSFNDYVGQSELINKLKIAIAAAFERNEPPDHILLYGPPGLGKTTIAIVIANECNKEPIIVAAPSLKSVADLVGILSKLKQNDILFIDEIHSLDRKIEEVLYSAIEDFYVSIKLGNKELTKLPISPFCLIGATTNPGKMSAPLRDRFGIIYTMKFYNDDELCSIIAANIKKLNVRVDSEESIVNLAKRSRGTPRIANRLLRRARDYSQLNNKNIISNEMVEKSMSLEGIDEFGLTLVDKKYLAILYGTYNCGPCGIQPLAASCAEDQSTISDFIEPFLMRKGFVARSLRGRILTADGMRYVVENLSRN